MISKIKAVVASVPRALAAWIREQGYSAHMLLAAMVVFFIVLGMFLNGISIVVLTTSVILPMVLATAILTLFPEIVLWIPQTPFLVRALPQFLLATLIFQVILPLCAIAGLWAFGAMETIIGIGAVLVLAAAPLTGRSGLTIMAGADPAPALRQLVLGTALLPLTGATGLRLA